MTDDQRRHLQAEIAAALLLIYGGQARSALDALGRPDQPVDISPEARSAIDAFVAERALKIQRGTNSRLAAAVAALPDDATPDDEADALAAARQKIDDHNHTILIPFMVSWAAHAGLVDTYRDTTTDAGIPAVDATLWQWQQLTDFLDDCTAAMDASPVPLDELVAITGSIPPVHMSCQCDLFPVG